MPDYIGNIAVPEIAASGTFPIVPDYPHGRAQRPEVVIHQFGSGNAKIEQRFLLGTGAKRFTVRRAWLRDSERIALRNFWESKYGPYGAFTYNAPNDDGIGTTPYICRFANEPLSWEMVADWACSVGVTLIEIPTTTPEYALNATVTRFPSQALKDALLSQVQQVIPLVKIQPLQAGYPAIYLSDRRCTIGGQLYQARLVDFDGISQGMGNESDDASFKVARRHQRDLVPATVWHEIRITNVPQIRTTGRGVLGRDESKMRRFWVRGHYADYRNGAGLFGNPKLRCVFWIPEHQRGNAELGDVIPEYTLA